MVLIEWLCASARSCGETDITPVFETGSPSSILGRGTNETQNPDCSGFCAICEPEPCLDSGTDR